MANHQYLFFYAPGWDCPPGGPIRLGNIITSVKRPQRPLHCVPPGGGQEGTDVFSTEKRNVKYTKEKLRLGKFSILTKFLSILGIGIDISAEVNNSDEESFFFDTIETTQFIPTPAYLQQCTESDDVRRFLHMTRYRKPIFVITGLKIVTGAQANTHQSRTMGANVAAEVDGTVWSGGTVPLGVGPGVEGKVGNTASTVWEGSSDFVFAFCASKVYVGKATGQVVSEEEYRRGAMLGNEDQRVQGPELSVLEVEDPNAEGEGFRTEELVEDEDVVVCATPMTV